MATDNSSVVNLIRGQLSFIAGQIAHTGDMKVVTPVATMGIRGTVGIVSYGDTLSLTVANEDDGQVHSIEIRDNNGNVIGHATSVGGTWNVTAATAAEGARQTLNDLAVVQQLLNLQTIGQQIIQQLQNDAKSTQHAGSSSTYQVTVEKATDTTSKVTSTSTTTTTTVDSSGTTKDTTVVDQLQEFIPTVNNVTPPPFFIGDPTITHIELANLNAVGPIVSAAGNVVAFLAGDGLPSNNGFNPQSVYVYDRLTNTVKSMTDASVIVGTSLHTGEKFDSLPSVSADGHYVVFAGKYQQSVTLTDPNNAQNTFTQTNEAHETFIYNTRTGQTTLLSGNGNNPAISADGHYVAVESTVYVWTNSGQHSVIPRPGKRHQRHRSHRPARQLIRLQSVPTIRIRQGTSAFMILRSAPTGNSLLSRPPPHLRSMWISEPSTSILF